jgi:hypothetical protein
MEAENKMARELLRLFVTILTDLLTNGGAMMAIGSLALGKASMNSSPLVLMPWSSPNNRSSDLMLRRGTPHKASNAMFDLF